MDKFFEILDHKVTKIIINVILALIFLVLLACSIMYFIFTQNDNPHHEQFKKIWTGVLAILTIINTPLIALKIGTLIHNVSLAKKRHDMLIKEYYAKLKKGETENVESLDKKIIKDVKKAEQKYIDNLSPIDRIELWSNKNGKKIEGIIYYEILNIIKSKRSKNDKLDLIYAALLKYYDYDILSLQNALKTFL